MSPEGPNPERAPERSRSADVESSAGKAYSPPPSPAHKPDPSRRGAPDSGAEPGVGYSPPPRAGGSGGKSPMMPIVIAAVVVLAGLGIWMGTARQDTPVAPTAITAVQQQQELRLAAADIDWVATKMAQDLIKSGTVPPAPADAAAPVIGQGDPSVRTPAAGAPTTGTSGPTAAAPTVAPVPKHRAPTVRAPKRAPKPAAAQVAAAPAPAAAAPAAPDPQSAAPVLAAPPPSVSQIQKDPDPAATPLQLAAGPPELKVAVRALVEQAPEKTRQDIASGKQVIYKLHVLDNAYQDGDQVEIVVSGKSYGTIVLTNAGQDLLIPLTGGATSDVKAIARWDGGGGVTFGATSSLGDVRSRVMSVGQSDDWRVTAP